MLPIDDRLPLRSGRSSLPKNLTAEMSCAKHLLAAWRSPPLTNNPPPRCRKRRLNLQLHLTHWVLQDQPARMKSNSRRKHPATAVLAVTDNWESGLFQLDADLMLSASSRLHFK